MALGHQPVGLNRLADLQSNGQLVPHYKPDLLANRPPASFANAGWRYVATDAAEYQSTGTAWVAISSPVPPALAYTLAIGNI